MRRYKWDTAQRLANVHLSQRPPWAPRNFQWSLTSRYRIKQEAMGSVTQEISIVCLVCTTQCPGPCVCCGHNKGCFSPQQLQFNVHLFGRRLAPGMRSTLVLGPIFSCIHTSRQIEHRFITETVSLCVDENGVQGGQDYFNLPSPPKEGMWFFSEGNLNWTKVFSLQPAYNYYLGLRHRDKCLNLWKHNGSKYLPLETKVSVNSRPVEVPISKEIT